MARVRPIERSHGLTAANAVARIEALNRVMSITPLASHLEDRWNGSPAATVELTGDANDVLQARESLDQYPEIDPGRLARGQKLLLHGLDDTVIAGLASRLLGHGTP